MLVACTATATSPPKSNLPKTAHHRGHRYPLREGLLLVADTTTPGLHSCNLMTTITLSHSSHPLQEAMTQEADMTTSGYIISI